MMKKLVFTLVVAFIAIVSANAQWYVGGSFSVLHNDYKEHDKVSFSIAPEVGYNLTDQWAVAAELGYTNVDSKSYFNFAPYARYSFFEKKIVRLFIDGGIGVSTSDGTAGFELGVKPGIAIEVCEHLCFVAKYGFAGYRKDYRMNSTSGVSLSTEDLSFGFHYEF